MTSQERKLHRQGVEELTALLRDDPALEDLRQVLRRRHVRPSETLLASLMEDGDGLEWGALVTGDGRAIEYHRRIDLHRKGPRVLRWRDRTGDPQALVDHPQLAAALEMQGAATAADRMLHYFERTGSDRGAALCRQWLAMQSRSDVLQEDIDAFLARLGRESQSGSGWIDLEMQFRGWARGRGLEA